MARFCGITQLMCAAAWLLVCMPSPEFQGNVIKHVILLGTAVLSGLVSLLCNRQRPILFAANLLSLLVWVDPMLTSIRLLDDGGWVPFVACGLGWTVFVSSLAAGWIATNAGAKTQERK